MAREVNELVELEQTFRHPETGEPTNVDTLTLELRSPSGEDVTHTLGQGDTLERVEQGTYRASWRPTEAGTWHYRWRGTGLVDGTRAGEVFVEATAFDDTDGADDTIPRVEHVAGLLRSRTRENGTGRILGMFTDTTTPSRRDVEGYLTEAAGIVDAEIGQLEETSQHRPARRRAITLFAAVIVEDNHFSDEVEAGRSPRDRHYALYERLIKAILGGLNDSTPNRHGFGALAAKSATRAAAEQG